MPFSALRLSTQIYTDPTHRSVRAKVREMVKEANREKSRCTKEYIETDSDGAGEDDDDE